MNTNIGRYFDKSYGLPLMVPLPNPCNMPIMEEVCIPVSVVFMDTSFLSQYCLCDIQYPEITNPDTKDIFGVDPVAESKKSKLKKDLMIKHGRFSAKAESLLKILNTISSVNVTLVTAKRKAASRRGPLSAKRSTFIGVSRNGPHWQALITIKKRKTYIGSYRSERDAALAFDFYSILLHSLTAKTNFSYTKEDIVEMIYNFKRNGECFQPETLGYLNHTV